MLKCYIWRCCVPQTGFSLLRNRYNCNPGIERVSRQQLWFHSVQSWKKNHFWGTVCLQFFDTYFRMAHYQSVCPATKENILLSLGSQDPNLTTSTSSCVELSESSLYSDPVNPVLQSTGVSSLQIKESSLQLSDGSQDHRKVKLIIKETIICYFVTEKIRNQAKSTGETCYDSFLKFNHRAEIRQCLIAISQLIHSLKYFTFFVLTILLYCLLSINQLKLVMCDASWEYTCDL